MENKETNMKVKNVRIDKTILVETYIHEEWLQLLKECHNHCYKDFICVYCHCKKNLKMRINEHWKKGCDKVMDRKVETF
jgi:hypothetical protein